MVTNQDIQQAMRIRLEDVFDKNARTSRFRGRYPAGAAPQCAPEPG